MKAAVAGWLAGWPAGCPRCSVRDVSHVYCFKTNVYIVSGRPREGYFVLDDCYNTGYG
jgi:hypothetical protein